MFFILAAFFFFGSLIFAAIRSKMRYKSGRILTPFNILLVGVIFSALSLFLPVYINTFAATKCGPAEAVLISVHNMIRLFAGDGDFAFVTEQLSDASPKVFKAYSLFFSVLFVVAPILTFGFVLSFFKNLAANLKYIKNFFGTAFIFSELNEKSLVLAADLQKNKKRLVVFTDVYTKEEQKNGLIERAKEIGAVLFKKDVTDINFAVHSPCAEITFFAIGEDKSKNITTSLKIIERYKNRSKTNLYVFSSATETELILSGKCSSSKIKVRRVNDVQSLIFRNLYDVGYENIFKSAYTDNDGIRKIGALVIGMGQHGTEMAKALSWFCQMDGYQPEINCFDIDKSAKDKFISLCPELMDEKYNGKFDIAGETQYKITVHSGVDALTKSFDDLVAGLPRTTYVFISLGSDERNIAVAVKLRALFIRKGYNPQIQAVIYDNDKKEALAGVKNYSNQEYRIDFIGDIESSYTEKVILGSDLENIAKERHLKWGEEEKFWQYDYNYKSSVASVIHKKMKELCGISGVDKDPAKRGADERLALRVLEHRRWNAYMRSEGYVYSGSIEKSSRNDLAKQHNCLVAFADLPPAEQEKDDD